MCYRPKAEKVRYVHQPASWQKTVLVKENIMEEMESFTVRIEINGKQELRTVERVEADGWDLPKLIPRLYQGETLVETPNGYKILRIVQ
jgi:hypothetical protein